MKKWFTSTLAPAVGSVDIDSGHGRIETRSVQVPDDIEWLRERHPNWMGLRSIIAISATRELKHSTEAETRYFISSLDGTAPARLGKVVRAHWSVDVAFDEDQNRTRVGNSATNLAVIRHVALNLIKSEKSSKVGVKTKRAKAGWDCQFLLKILGMI